MPELSDEELLALCENTVFAYGGTRKLEPEVVRLGNFYVEFARTHDALAKVAKALPRLISRAQKAQKAAALWESDARNMKACWDAARNDLDIMEKRLEAAEKGRDEAAVLVNTLSFQLIEDGLMMDLHAFRENAARMAPTVYEFVNRSWVVDAVRRDDELEDERIRAALAAKKGKPDRAHDEWGNNAGDVEGRNG